MKGDSFGWGDVGGSVSLWWKLVPNEEECAKEFSLVSSKSWFRSKMSPATSGRRQVQESAKDASMKSYTLDSHFLNVKIFCV